MKWIDYPYSLQLRSTKFIVNNDSKIIFHRVLSNKSTIFIRLHPTFNNKNTIKQIYL